MNKGRQKSQDSAWIILDMYLKVALLHHRIILFLIFWGMVILLSIMAKPLYSPTKNAQEFWSFYSLTNAIFYYLDSGHPNGYEVMSHCGFDFHFPYLIMLSMFSYACWTLAYLFVLINPKSDTLFLSALRSAITVSCRLVLLL